MSKERIDDVAVAEAAALQLQAAEELAHGRFDAVRSRARANGQEHHSTDTPEFREWIAARHATDEAWGVWALAMDAKQAS